MSLDHSVPVPLVVYGVPFHNLTFEETVEWVARRIRSGIPAYIATANLDFVTQAWKDPELQRILINADLVLADGFPIVKLAPFFGPALKARVTGSDLTPMLANRAAQEGFRIFGLGGETGVANSAMDILKERFPDLKVAGAYSPPFTSLLDMDHRDILKRLESAKPDLLFVALGSPKQEKFINMHVRGWNVPVAMGIGASLDFIAGKQKRAPVWMRKTHLEWLWRICGDPRRLFHRYLANLQFLVSASHKMIAIHFMADRTTTSRVLEDSETERLATQDIDIERFFGLKDEAAAREFIGRFAGKPDQRNLLLDIHAVPWLNSMELGALLEVNKLCRRKGKRLILYAPRPKVRRLLDTCRLSDYFDTAIHIEEVERFVKRMSDHEMGNALFNGGALTLELPVELTAATLPRFEQDAEIVRQGLQMRHSLKTVHVDASQLDFIDSSGLGFLISLKKAMQDEGVSLSISNLGGKARRVFEIAKVDKVLLHA